MRRQSFVLATALIALLCGQPATARQDGIFGVNTVGCGGGGCHGMSASDLATVTITAPDLVAPGAGGDITVTVDGPEPSANPIINRGGFNLRAEAGRLSSGAGTVRFTPQANEATHTLAGNDQRSWIVRWDPPSIPTLCAFPLRAAGNAVNGDAAASADDHWNVATPVSIAVDVAGDGALPDGEVIRPAEGAFYFGDGLIGYPGVTLAVGDLTLEVRVTDDTGIASVVVEDTDSLGTETLGEATWNGVVNNQNVFRLFWAASQDIPGPHTLRFTVTDCAGNTTEILAEVFVL